MWGIPGIGGKGRPGWPWGGPLGTPAGRAAEVMAAEAAAESKGEIDCPGRAALWNGWKVR